MEQYADVILPVTTFAETAGSYIGLDGQRVHQAAPSAHVGNSRPGLENL